MKIIIFYHKREVEKCIYRIYIYIYIPFFFLYFKEHFMKMIAIPSTRMVVTMPTPAPIPSPTVMFNCNDLLCLCIQTCDYTHSHACNLQTHTHHTYLQINRRFNSVMNADQEKPVVIFIMHAANYLLVPSAHRELEVVPIGVPIQNDNDKQVNF